MTEASNTEANASPRPRNRTRNRVLLGIPPAPRARNRTGGFVDRDPDIPDDGIESLAPMTHIDVIVQRYAGQAIPMDQAFPAPPPPDGPLNTLSRAVQSSAGQYIIAPENPARMNTTANSEAAYLKEHQLTTLHRMIFRKASTAQMAAGLGISVSEVFRLRDELFRRLRQEAGSIDMLVHAGRTIAFYDEIRGTAMRNLDATGATHVDKARYMTIALAAENSKHKFLQVAGFYDSAKMTPKDADSTSEDDDMSIITGAMRALFHPDEHERELDDVLSGSYMDRDTNTDDLVRVL